MKLKHLLSFSLASLCCISPAMAATEYVKDAYTGETYSFDSFFWRKLADVNARLQQRLTPPDYSEILKGELYWYTQRREHGAEACPEGMKDENMLLQRLEKIAGNPEDFRLFPRPFFMHGGKQSGPQYKGDLRHDREMVHFADDRVTVTQTLTKDPFYSFWDTRTCRLIGKVFIACTIAEVAGESKSRYRLLPFQSSDTWSGESLFSGSRDTTYIAVDLERETAGRVKGSHELQHIAQPLRSLEVAGRVQGCDDSSDSFITRQLNGIDELFNYRAALTEIGKRCRFISYQKIQRDIEGYSEDGFPSPVLPYWWGGNARGECMAVASAARSGLYSVYDLDSLTMRRGSAGIALTRSPFSSQSKKEINDYGQVITRQGWVMEEFLNPDSEAAEKSIPALFAKAPWDPYDSMRRTTSGVVADIAASNPVKGSFLCIFPTYYEAYGGTYSTAVYLVRGKEVYTFQRTKGDTGKIIPLFSSLPEKRALNFLQRGGESWLAEHTEPGDATLLAWWEENGEYLGLFTILDGWGGIGNQVVLISVDMGAKTYRLCRRWTYTGEMTPAWFNRQRMLFVPESDHEYSIVKIAGADRQERIGSMFVDPERGFAVALADGRYGGTAGCESLMRWCNGRESVDMAALALWRNRPGEVLEALGGNPDDVAALKETTRRWLLKQGYTEASLSPEPELADLPKATPELPKLRTTSRDVSFAVRVVPGLRPVKELSVRINGVEQPRAAEIRAAISSPESVACSVHLGAGQNWVEVTPVDTAGIHGQTESFRVVCDAAAMPETYVVAMGVSRYNDDSMSLRYAAKDAADLAAAFQRCGAGRVHTLLLTDAEVKAQGAMDQIRGFLAAATEDDSIIMYCAGHGLLDDQLNYYYAPSDIDTERLAETGIGMDALTACLEGTKSRRRLLLLDTCHSGAMGEADEERLASIQGSLPHGVRAVAKRGMKVKSVSLLKDAKQKKRYMEEMFSRTGIRRGVNVIAGAAGSEFALESDKWNNGVFTASIMEALRGTAQSDINGDGRVSVAELSYFLSASVRKLTSGTQQPDASLDFGDDFIVAETPVAAINRADWQLLDEMLERGVQVQEDFLPEGRSAISLAKSKGIPPNKIPSLIKAGADPKRKVLHFECQEASIGKYNNYVQENTSATLSAGSVILEGPYATWSAEQLRKEGGRLSDAGQQEQALQLIMSAAIMGDSTAQCWLGWRHIQGRGVSKDRPQAAYWFGRAAAQGDSAAWEALRSNDLLNAASAYTTSYSSMAPYATWSAEQLRKEGGRLSDAGQQEQALQLIISAAAMGDSTAQRWLGFRYLNGRGVEKDKQQAVYWFQRADIQGDSAATEALRSIGLQYGNPASSVSYSPADPYAGWTAEQLRQEGGRLSDAGQQEQAIQLIMRAANAGDSTAQRWLGWRYIQGRGVAKDKQQAAYWFGRAAAQGDSAAAEALRSNGLQAGNSAPSSSYTSADPYAGWSAERLRQEGGRLSDAGQQEQALQLIMRAANAGDSTAQRWLGFRYLNGRGVAQDKQQARYWFSRAAAQGDSKAADALKDIR
ncbi:MAG: caspase family protein [Akkermansia sp.]|nr:caspase family protein [Akkermansia sp.]